MDHERANIKRSGFVALVGRPNVGKSTLMNRLIGQKLSIVSHKPQTTRHRILGIHTSDNAQIAYVDTPGIHRRAGRALNRQMNRSARSALADVDVVLWLVEAGRYTGDDKLVSKAIADAHSPVYIAINKVDLIADKAELLPFAQQLGEVAGNDEIFMISARTGTGVDELQNALLNAMPEGPALYADGQLTDRGERFFVSELIREQVTRRLHQELPYAASVEIETLEQADGRTRIGAVIWVERDSQKGIVIGRGGQTLKAIGTAARRSIGEFLHAKVHLDLWVKVKRGWADDDRQLRQWGYSDA